MQKTIYILIILLCLLSCGKKQEIKISAINPVTGEMYAGLKYTITEEKTGTQEIYKTVAKGTLNANGTALVSLRLKNRSYLINIEKPINNCYLEPQDITFDKSYSSFDFRFELLPCANLNLKINNINCNSSDLISFNRIWLTKDDVPTPVTHVGCFNFDGGFFDLPIGNYKYEWDVTKNGVTTHHDSLFTLVENQYFTFSIEY